MAIARTLWTEQGRQADTSAQTKAAVEVEVVEVAALEEDDDVAHDEEPKRRLRSNTPNLVEANDLVPTLRGIKTPSWEAGGLRTLKPTTSVCLFGSFQFFESMMVNVSNVRRQL